MRALLTLTLPFHVVIPKDEDYKSITYSDDEYEVIVTTPHTSNQPVPHNFPEVILYNDKPAFFADAVTIEFRKPEFIRLDNAELDPPNDVINRALASFLTRLKYVTSAARVHVFDFRTTTWHMKYLDNNGEELPEQRGQIRGRGAVKISFSYINCDPRVWDDISSLPSDFSPPPWHSLMVDSLGALPHVGTAIVLVATALEVFIAQVLKQLIHHSNAPNELWKWILERGDYEKDPSVEEQLSVLLKSLCGHSLKEEDILWEAAKNIRSARNTFVHQGTPMIGRSTVSIEKATYLIQKGHQIVTKIREWLPTDLQWPIFIHPAKIEMKKLLKVERRRTDKHLPPPNIL